MDEQGTSTHVIDKAPGHERDVVGYFRRLEKKDLAKCWVAVVTDLVSGHVHLGHTLEVGPFAMALVAVAERLHGVSFPEGVHGMAPIVSEQRGSAAVQQGRGTPMVGARPATNLHQPASDRVSIEVHAGDAPEPKSGGGKVKHPEVIEVFEKLGKAPVGAWLIFPDSIAKYRVVSSTLRGLRRRKLMLDIVTYVDAMGRTVVKKAEAKKGK